MYDPTHAFVLFLGPNDPQLGLLVEHDRRPANLQLHAGPADPPNRRRVVHTPLGALQLLGVVIVVVSVHSVLLRVLLC